MSENQMLFAQVLPQHPVPYPGECVSGYLVRLAEANGFTTFWELARDLFLRFHAVGQLPLLRWEYPLDDWGRIPMRAQLSPTQLRAMSVAPLVEKFRAPIVLLPGDGRSPGQSLQGIVRPDLAVCPQCLQAEPYVRLLWRLIPARVCLTHRCLLQERCSQCGRTLRAMSTAQPHLRCADCGMDLRRLSVAPAPDNLIGSQTRRQADLRFLLNPAVSLVEVTAEDEAQPLNLAKAIGRKIRFLRLQADLSLADVAKRIGIQEPQLGMLERGKQSPLLLYMSYLEGLSLSWASFAELPVPHPSKLHREPAYFALRICPNPECPNHVAPSERVSLQENLTASQKIEFGCTTCGRHFTRRYDGQLVTKARSPIRPIHSRVTKKPPDEFGRLLELGRQGLSDQEIHTLFGWSDSTIRRYWIVLGVEEEIYEAQVKRRFQKKQERNAEFQTRVKQIVQSILCQNEEITFERICKELHCSYKRLRHRPDLVDYIHRMIQTHNPLVRQQHEEELNVHLMNVIADLKRQGQVLSIRLVLEHMEPEQTFLIRRRPKIYAMMRQIISEYNAGLHLARRQRETALINESAERLVAQGIRLSQIGILKEARINSYRLMADPAIHELLESWVGDRISHR